jgi:hypothetical protein
LLEDRNDLAHTSFFQLYIAVVVDGRILNFHCFTNFYNLGAANAQICARIARLHLYIEV